MLAPFSCGPAPRPGAAAALDSVNSAPSHRQEIVVHNSAVKQLASYAF